MSLGTSPSPEPDRRELERELQQAAEEARAALIRATDPGERARAAERLKMAVQKLMESTLPGGPGRSDAT